MLNLEKHKIENKNHLQFHSTDIATANILMYIICLSQYWGGKSPLSTFLWGSYFFFIVDLKQFFLYYLYFIRYTKNKNFQPQIFYFQFSEEPPYPYLMAILISIPTYSIGVFPFANILAEICYFLSDRILVVIIMPYIAFCGYYGLWDSTTLKSRKYTGVNYLTRHTTATF